MAGDYTDWVGQSIETLEKAGAANPPAILREITRIAHEFRGQGGIFDYPLTSEFGKSLFEATQDRSYRPAKS